MPDDYIRSAAVLALFAFGVGLALYCLRSRR